LSPPVVHGGGVPVQRAYLIGKLYRETKKEPGGDRGNQYTAPKGNNFPLPTTAERIAEQFNVGHATVRRAGPTASMWPHPKTLAHAPYPARRCRRIVSTTIP